MADNQDFDTELDTNDVEFTDQPQQQNGTTKKSGSGILFKLVVFLVVALGGGFYFLKVSGIQLPVNIPGLSQSGVPQKQAGGAVSAPVAPAGMSPEEAAAPPIENFAALPPAVDEATGEQVVNEALKAPANPDLNSVDPMTAMRQMTEHPIQMPETGASDGQAGAGQDPLAAGSDLSGVTSAVPAQNPDMAVVDPLADATTPVTAGMPDVTTVPVEVDNGVADQVPSMDVAQDIPAVSVGDQPIGADTPAVVPSKSTVEPEMASPAPRMVPEKDAAPVVRVAQAPEQAPVQAASEDTTALKKRIAELEDKLSVLQNSMDDLQQSIASAQSNVQPDAQALEKSTAVETEAVHEARSEVRAYNNGEMPTVVKAKSAKKKSPAATAGRSRVTSASSTASTNWVLKSAKTGTAWVAVRGSSELKTVTVGESLSGIGRITSIDKNEMGRWVVNGTRGRISQ